MLVLCIKITILMHISKKSENYTNTLDVVKCALSEKYLCKSLISYVSLCVFTLVTHTLNHNILYTEHKAILSLVFTQVSCKKKFLEVYLKLDLG